MNKFSSIASWPDRRIYAWDSLLKARAIENMSYVVGVNRFGKDPNGVEYSGHSQALDYMGNYLIEPFSDQDIKIIELNKEQLLKVRTKFAFLNDADELTYYSSVINSFGFRVYEN